MTNKIALWLGALILIALVLDIALQGGTGVIFLMSKLADMIEWMAFWR